MRTIHSLVFCLALALAVPSAGCSVFDPSLAPPDETDAAVECGRDPTPPPDGMDDGEDIGTQVFALRNVVLEQTRTQANDTGFDLDRFCTETVEDPHECVTPANGEVITDGNDGIDNVFGRDFYQNVDTVLSISPDPIIREAFCEVPLEDGACPQGEDRTFQQVARQNQDAGTGTLLVVVNGWNGTANDPRIEVIVAQALDGTPCAEKDNVELADFDGDGFEDELVVSGVDPMQEAPPPVWDGSDENCWWLRSDAFTTGNPDNPPVIFDDRSYVNEGRTVFNLPDGRDIRFFAGPVGAIVTLTGGVGAATIDLETDELTDVVVAGRWAITDLIETGKHVGACDGCPPQTTLTNFLDEGADVRRMRPDSPSMDSECNAISMGVAFEVGVQGQLVTEADGETPVVGDGPPLPDPCEGVSCE